MLRGLLQTFGIFVLLFSAYKAVSFISLYVLPGKSLKKYGRSPRAWAFITGASAGIGYAYAEELASRGFNLILLGHKPDELASAQKTILSNYRDTKIEIRVQDASTASNAAIADLTASLSHLPITILVNNVGGVPIPVPQLKYFNEFRPDEINATITMNAVFMTQLTHSLLPMLIRNGPSLVLNVSSGGKIGLPGFTVYCATKGYVSSFSNSFARECKVHGWPIDVLCVTPGDTHSQGNRHAVEPGSPTAAQFAKALLDRAPRAIERGMLEIKPVLIQALEMLMADFVPESVVMSNAVRVFEAKRKAHADEEAAKRKHV